MSYPWIKDSQYLPIPVTGYLAVTSPNGIYAPGPLNLLSDGDLTTTSSGSTILDAMGNSITIGNGGADNISVNATDSISLVTQSGSIDLNVNSVSGQTVRVNPSTNDGTLTCATVVGDLTGNASSATTATTATNLSGGSGGEIPYQSAANTTALLPNGTAGQLLQSNGTTLAPSWTSPPSPSISLPTAVLTETQATGVSSPISFTASGAGTLRPRQFNTVVNNGLAITLGGSPNFGFTIPTAGTYLFDAVVFYSIGVADGSTTLGKLFLNNQTLVLASSIVGMSSRFGTRNSGIFVGINNACFLNGILTITRSNTFTLDHIVANPFQTNTGGYATGLASSIETYATLKITKLA